MPATPADRPDGSVASAELPPKDTEQETFYDPASGVREHWFGSENRHFAIDPRNDPTCRQDPAMRR